MTITNDFGNALATSADLFEEAFGDYDGAHAYIDNYFQNQVASMASAGVNYVHFPDIGGTLVRNFIDQIEPVEFMKGVYQETAIGFIGMGLKELAAAPVPPPAIANIGNFATRQIYHDIYPQIVLNTAQDASNLLKGIVAFGLGLALIPAAMEIQSSQTPLIEAGKQALSLSGMAIGTEGAAAALKFSSIPPLQKLAIIGVSGGMTGYLFGAGYETYLEVLEERIINEEMTKEEALAAAEEHAQQLVDDLWELAGTAAENVWAGVLAKMGELGNLLDGLRPENNWCPVLPGFVDDALIPWNIAPSTGSPLVLDLVGTGIDLTTFNAATTATFFDIDGDGFAEQTAWIGTGMGLLARDLNENGTIDAVNELFGSSSIDGFALLATLDSNGDHVINQYDSGWSELVVWIDANGDAVTQDGELHTLASLDIVSFDLAGVAASTSTIGGNPISHTSTYLLENGTTRSIVDAWFVHDNVNSAYAEDYTLDIRTLFLPTLRGFGELPSLHIAMSQNEDLLELVQDFVASWDISRFEGGAALDSDVRNILWAWAGVEGVAANSRGGKIDARNLGFIEAFFGNDFLQNGVNPNPYVNAAAKLNEAWERLFYALKAQLMVQAGAGEIYGGTISYNVFSGELEGDMELSQEAIDAIESSAPAPGSALHHYWEQVAEFIAFTKGFTNIESGETAMIVDALTDSGSSYSWTQIQYSSVPNWVGVANPGSSDDDTIIGTSGNDNLSGGAGDDYLNGGDGDDTIDGGTGDDHLNGGNGDDTLYGGDGNDVIHTGSGTNTAYGGAGDDKLYGYTGVDMLDGGDGNDILEGHDGADILKPGTGGNRVLGGNGDDTYWYGFGDDVYSESGKTGADVILMPSGIDSGDISFVRVKPSTESYSDNLTLLIEGAGSIELENMFQYGRNLRSQYLETIKFDDNSTLGTATFSSLITYGTSGADVIDGVKTAFEVDDIIYGYGGDDTLKGHGGDDTLDGGIGNDKLIGGDGNDLYLASPGFDVINESSGTDTIRLPAGFDASDVSFLRLADKPYHLQITIQGLGQIVIENLFKYANNAVETLDFDGSGAISLTTMSVETIGTSGNDNLTKITTGASINDIMDGGLGNDTLGGYEGDDTYWFSPGADVIYENGGTDIVRFREGVLPTDIQLYRAGNLFRDLFIADNNGNTLKVSNHFYNANSSIEKIFFSIPLSGC